jgi:hypothetical protein
MDDVENEFHYLDNKWIADFEKTDELYKDFYKENNYYVNVHYVYTNTNNEIDKIKQEIAYMSKPNYILRDELIGFIKRNSNDNNKRYSLLSILKINIDLQPTEIKDFLIEDYGEHYKNQFCTIVKNIDTIIFEKTINMFQDLNDIYIIFYEKSNTNTNNTKPNNITKKIYLTAKTGNKKTIKKTI